MATENSYRHAIRRGQLRGHYTEREIRHISGYERVQTINDRGRIGQPILPEEDRIHKWYNPRPQSPPQSSTAVAPEPVRSGATSRTALNIPPMDMSIPERVPAGVGSVAGRAVSKGVGSVVGWADGSSPGTGTGRVIRGTRPMYRTDNTGAAIPDNPHRAGSIIYKGTTIDENGREVPASRLSFAGPVAPDKTTTAAPATADASTLPREVRDSLLASLQTTSSAPSVAPELSPPPVPYKKLTIEDTGVSPDALRRLPEYTPLGKTPSIWDTSGKYAPMMSKRAPGELPNWLNGVNDVLDRRRFREMSRNGEFRGSATGAVIPREAAAASASETVTPEIASAGFGPDSEDPLGLYSHLGQFT